MQCIKQATSTTLCQLTIIKLDSGFSLAAEKGNKDAEDVLRNHLRYNRFTKKWDAIR